MFWTLVLVIPSFVFFYGWQSSSQRNEYGYKYLARVKDRWFGLRWRNLTQYDEYRARRILIERYRRFMQSLGLPEDAVAKATSLVGPQEIARAALDAYFMQRLARRKGLTVTELELREIIQGTVQALRAQYPNIGATDSEVFRAFLKAQRMSEQEYLSNLAYERQLAKAEYYIASRAMTSLFELWQEYLIGQEKIRIRYVRIPRADFEKKVVPTTSSLYVYFEDNKEDYRVPERHAFRYVAVVRSEIEKEMEPTTDSVRRFYEEHKEDLFSRKRSVRVRHIFIEAGPTSSTAQVEQARKRIQAIADQLTSGADFAQLADRYGEDPNAQPGGLLTVPVREDLSSPWGEAFKKTALALEKDEISTPVRGARGFHLIKADQVTTAGVMPFDQVAEHARRRLRNELTDAALRQRGEALIKLFDERSFSTLDAFAEVAGLPIRQTGLVDLQQGFIEGIGSIRDSIDMIREMGVGEFSQGVFKNYNAYYVLELARKEPSHIPDFTDVAADVRDDYVTSQAAHLAHELARTIARDATSSESLQTLAEKHGYKLLLSEPFTREEAGRPGGVLPNLNPQFTYATLRFPVGSIHVSRQGGDPERPMAYVVWYFEKREPPSLEQFRRDLPSIEMEYLAQLQQALVEEWLHDQRRRVRSELNPQFMTDQSEEEKSG